MVRRFAKMGVRCVLLAVAVIALCGGCASTHMKGTPFYTGEYNVRRGPVEDRVNLWPLLYYREPALSVLWPFIEKTDEHFAVRPLMSVHGLGTDDPVTNVLWPIARFDPGERNRIFPFFWGPDYFVGFPLYWHFDEPFGEGGYDGLLPLWSYRSGGEQRTDLHLLWPFLHFKHWTDNKTGWRVWPLLGSYNTNGWRYRFAFWPLGHQWSLEGESTGGSCLVPLYFYNRDASGTVFLSLPYSRGKTGDETWETVLPLYHRRSSDSLHQFYSLLYSHSVNSATQEKWSFAVPLWFSKSSPDERLLATLAGGYWRDGDRMHWMAVPLLAGGRRTPDGGDVWALGPLVHAGWRGDSSSHHVFPFYYRSQSPDGERFYSPLWSAGRNADGDNWQLLFPVFFRHQDEDSRTLVTPFYAQGTADDGDTTWRSIIPLALNRKTRNAHLFATLVGGYRKSENDLAWLVFPLLTGGRTGDSEGSFWAAAPLVHARWDEDHATHHVLPLYYWNGESGTLLSLPFARWKTEQASTVLVPPAISWLTAREDRKDLWLLGPLAHLSWGPEATSNHVFPLYYANSKHDTFLSLFLARWWTGDTRVWLVPPLLSAYTSEANRDRRNLYAALGLFRQQWGADADSAGHLFPLYMYSEDDYVFTPLFGWKHGQNGFAYPFTPLVGVFGGDYTGGWVFPFWSRRVDPGADRAEGNVLWGHYWRERDEGGSVFFPFYGYRSFGPKPKTPTDEPKTRERYGRRFWSLPACWYQDVTTVYPENVAGQDGERRTVRKRHVKKHGFFPFWHFAKREWLERETKQINASILLLLYDYKRRLYTGKDETPDPPKHDYTRSRVLWRLWHYEKSDGDVSVDIFPAITYDSKTNGFRKASFLWRLFRYETGPKGTKLDLLFLPIIRKDDASSGTSQ
mgnify:CR=1 FL=1